jgi:hypothetical protein
MVVRTYVLSRANRRKDCQNGRWVWEGGSRGRIRRHAMMRRPLTRLALARTAFPKPRVLRVLLSMMGWTTAPREEPDATMAMASARRFWK